MQVLQRGCLLTRSAVLRVLTVARQAGLIAVSAEGVSSIGVVAGGTGGLAHVIEIINDLVAGRTPNAVTVAEVQVVGATLLALHVDVIVQIIRARTSGAAVAELVQVVG